MRKINILITDDDKGYVEILAGKLGHKYKVSTAFSEEEFWDKYIVHGFDLIVLDIKLRQDGSGREGLEILKKVKSLDPDQEVVMLTQYKGSEFFIDAINTGATIFISKIDYNISAVVKIIDIIIEKNELKKEVKSLKNDIFRLNPYDIIGKSKKIKEVKDHIKNAALDGEITVLITGESGTGKELVARNIHKTGIRSKGPFVAVSVSGLNKDTIYSELFGHEKGSFTGAHQRKKGFFEEAHKGVLFLDEIGDLEPEVQVKLLRVLENKSFTRLGGTKEVKVDVQFVAATNRNLEEMVSQGSFRADLYYRLKAFEIHIPPLRERKEDIEPLIKHFLSMFRTQGRTSAESVSKEVLKIFFDYHWPGNVRELKNVLEFASIQARGERVIKLSHLPKNFGGVNSSNEINRELVMDYKKALALAELELVNETIFHRGIRKKSELAEILHYPNRFTFMRRIRRIFANYPELRKRFPEVSLLFPEGKSG